MAESTKTRVVRGPTNVAAIRALESSVPCVSLTGSHGVGKTFLARNVGGRKVFDYVDRFDWWQARKALDSDERIAVILNPDGDDLVADFVALYPRKNVGGMTARMKQELIESFGLTSEAEEYIHTLKGTAREYVAAAECIRAAGASTFVEAVRATQFTEPEENCAFDCIALAVCHLYNLTAHELSRKSNTRRLGEARMALWLATKKLHPELTLQEIGRKTSDYGGREKSFHHSTIITSLREAEERDFSKSEKFQKLLSILGANDYDD